MKMKKLNTKTKQTVDKFWVAITHPEALDEKENYIPQGYCEISIEILPKAFADEIPNG